MARIPQRLDPVEDRVRDRLLGGHRDMVPPPRLDDHDLVLGALEADLRARDVVEDDRVGALALELLPSTLRIRIGFGREADDGLTLTPASRQSSEDVLRRLEIQLDAAAPFPVDL